MVAGAKRWLKKVYNRATGSWESGLGSEIKFWDDWLSNYGLRWPEEYRNRLNLTYPLAENLRKCIDHLPQKDIKILDVGAGPLTSLGKKHPSKRLIIIPTDALAKHYDALLEKHHIHPPVRTLAVEAERLTNFFPSNTFDLVYARNSIDHCYNPLEAIRKMLVVLKHDCFLVLEHSENEAESELYSGLHQWNFTINRKGAFIIKGKSRYIDVSRELAHASVVSCYRNNTTILVHIRKNKSLSGRYT